MIAAVLAVIKGASVAIKGFSLLKYVSPVLAALAFGKDYVVKYWKITIIAILAAALIAGGWLHNREVTGLERDLAHYQLLNRETDRALAINQKAVERLIAVNRANAHGLLLAQFRADEAEIRLRVLAAEKDKRVEVINEEVVELRGRDEDCRSLDDPLPDWFDEWLRK